MFEKVVHVQNICVEIQIERQATVLLDQVSLQNKIHETEIIREPCLKLIGYVDFFFF